MVVSFLDVPQKDGAQLDPFAFYFPSSQEASHGFLHQNYPCHAEGTGRSVRGRFPKVG